MKWIFTLLLGGLVLVSKAQYFESVPDSPINNSGDASRSAAFVDVDDDGFEDIFISNGPESGQNNTLYMNLGNGTFSESISDPVTSDGDPSDGATWGDIDNDGDVDLFVVNWYGVRNLLYLNNGNGTFLKSTDKLITRGGYSETASWADFNKDGYLDLYGTNSSPDLRGTANNLFINNGDGRFTSESGNIIALPREDSRSVNWIDYDNDSDLDIFISNENNTANRLYRNDDGAFVEVLDIPVVTDKASSMGSSWGDYDNDGDLDLFVANYNQRSQLYRNDGNDIFSPVSNAITNEIGYSFGSSWGDIDNDGDLDLFVANAFKVNPAEPVQNFLFINQGDGSFIRELNDVVATDLGWTFGAAFGDYDNDGFLDLVTANTDGPEDNALYHNLGNDHNWVNIRCRGSVSNYSAIGAKVRIKAIINGNEVWQMREISSQSGYNCQNSMRVHFGVGDATNIDEMIIEWPLGNVEEFENIAINTFHEFTEQIPSGFVRANFKVNVLAHPSGEEVKFENLSVFDPQLETNFSWDFDGDGIEDSNEMNPSFIYGTEGFYNVSLTVSNDDHSDIKVRESYIEIDDSIITTLTDLITNDVRVYPNPFKDYIKVQSFVSNDVILKVSISDMMGRTLLEHDQQIVNTATLNPGIYVLQVHTLEGKIMNARVVKR